MTRSDAPSGDRLKIGYLERHMCLPGRPKVVLNAEVKLQIANLKPNPASRA
jgi:hypothetical protein